MLRTLPTFNLPRQVSSEITTSVVDYATYQSTIHAIRHAVFVNEQSIPTELEVDKYDSVSHHVLAWWAGQAVGTGRLLPNGHIGRVAVVNALRRRGIGRCVVQELLNVASHKNHTEVILAAQCHAIRFYEKFGFQQDGSVFEKLGINHVMMRKQIMQSMLIKAYVAPAEFEAVAQSVQS